MTCPIIGGLEHVSRELPVLEVIDGIEYIWIMIGRQKSGKRLLLEAFARPGHRVISWWIRTHAPGCTFICTGGAIDRWDDDDICRENELVALRFAAIWHEAIRSEIQRTDGGALMTAPSYLGGSKLKPTEWAHCASTGTGH